MKETSICETHVKLKFFLIKDWALSRVGVLNWKNVLAFSGPREKNLSPSGARNEGLLCDERCLTKPDDNNCKDFSYSVLYNS